MTLEFHPEAEEELLEAAHWYEDRSIYAGDRFLTAVRLAAAAIVADPHRYQPVGDGVRVYRLKRYPFRLYYVVEKDGQVLRLYAVMHEKRRPDYWRARLRTD